MRTLSAVVMALVIGVFTPGPTSATQAPTSPSANVCALFSLEDARNIMTGALKPKPFVDTTVCSYELTEGYGTVALTVIRSSDRAAEDRAWASIKETRHLQAGQKNTRPLAGIGDEAWFDGAVKAGKAGASSVVARKGNAHFAIDVMTLDYRASPQQMTAIAKRIASQL